MKAFIVFAVDALCAIGALAAIWVAFTGGGVYNVAGTAMSAHSSGTAILCLTAIVIVRLFASPGVPFLLHDGWQPIDLGQRISTWLVEIGRRSKNLKPETAVLVVLAITAFAFVLRAAIAWWYSGFYSGDDVELLELVFSQLYGDDYRTWELRNPFFPMVFLFPGVYFASLLGAQNPEHLIFVARLVVVFFSVIGVWAAYRAGLILLRSEVGGVVTAIFVALSGISTRFSASVLPRAAAGTFVLVAFVLLLSKTSRHRELFAGFLLGVAAAMRFSEVLAGMAAVLVLIFERRTAAAVRVAVSCVATMALALGLADWLFRGDPLLSTISIVEYTLLQGRSSRGTQPPWEYLPLLISGVSMMAIVFAAQVWKLRESRHLLTWFAAPLLALSFLPHKEIRYLVPYVPVFMVMVSVGLWQAVKGALSASQPRRSQLVLVVVVAVSAMLLHQVDSMRFRRSRDAVACAKIVAASMDSGAVAFEQSWRAGGKIFLPSSVRLREINTRTIADPTQTLRYASNPEVRFIGLRYRHAVRYGYIERLAEYGFVPVQLPSDEPDYMLFERLRSNLN